MINELPAGEASLCMGNYELFIKGIARDFMEERLFRGFYRLAKRRPLVGVFTSR